MDRHIYLRGTLVAECRKARLAKKRKGAPTARKNCL